MVGLGDADVVMVMVRGIDIQPSRATLTRSTAIGPTTDGCDGCWGIDEISWLAGVHCLSR
ncbi:hypothetical protein IV500_01030 [Paeniglutamicibacter antarcticus]|uniref:Uncharacterized protein n=1 Tax=Arthrobacter terrae TaxID=2935737 RepID=A0A931CLF6_9MICC|nr:hypothetical protein [Arthrobacter terrae]MBG0738021.1 hypothetical protein [Arthrobacter terrae]